MEVIELDGFKVSMHGDYFETLIWIDGDAKDAVAALETMEGVQVFLHEEGGRKMIEVKAPAFVSDEMIAALDDVSCVKRLAPVLPILSNKDTRVPFTTCEEMLGYDAGRGTPIWKLAVQYEMERGNLTEAEVIAKMVEIVRTYGIPSPRASRARNTRIACSATNAGNSAR